MFGQGALSFSAGKVSRSQTHLNVAEIISQLRAITSRPAAELLRIYWYDGTRGDMTDEQKNLAETADVKVRLGYINSAGQQKDVDSLIVTDLIELARNQAIGDAYLVSGDGDLRIAVQIAQSFGVRVHLITLEPSNASLNPKLRQEADTRHEISKSEVLKFLGMEPPQTTVLSFAASADETPNRSVQASTMTAAHAQTYVTVEQATKQAIRSVFAAVPHDELAKLRALQTGQVVPREYDRKVLGTARTLLGRDLTPSERAEMRKLVSEWLHKS